MGTLPPTSELGLVLPDPGTNQPFSVAVQNGWFQTIDARFANHRSRIAVVEATTAPGGATPGLVPAGTTAQRTTFWGTPGDAAARVALAAKGARWFNTDLGYEEQYFAAKADAGSAANLAAPAAGWYPMGGRVPQGHATRSDTAGTISSSSYTDLSGDTHWTNRRVAGGMIFASGWKVPVAGYYEVSAMVQGNLATGVGIAGFGVNTSPTAVGTMHGATTNRDIQSILVLEPVAVIEMAANDTVKLAAFGQPSNIPWVTGGNAHWAIKYRGPVIGA